MTLAEWLKAHGMSQRKFAAMVGVSGPAICYLVNGETTRPLERTARRIYEITGIKLPARPKPGHIPDLARWRRIVEAKEYGASYYDIAGRFGFKDSKAARSSFWYARKALARYDARSAG